MARLGTQSATRADSWNGAAMKIEINGRPQFNFTLTDEQMAVLTLLSDLHYDAACKMANMVGGFIYGWRNARHHKSNAQLRASFREVDTCLKILEGLAFPPSEITIGQIDVGRALVKSFRVALTHANKETQSWSTEIEA